MQVTNVRVSFLREKQPAQYEKAQPAVEFAAVLDEGDNPFSVARALLLEAATLVYAGIGYAVPDKVLERLESGEPVAGVTTTVVSQPAAQETQTKKPRGRPAGSKNTAPVKEAAPIDDLPPSDDEAKPAISTGDARVGPDDSADDHGIPSDDDGIPDDSAPAQASFGPKELHTMINQAIKDKKLSVANAKQVLAHFGVARAQDLTEQQAAEGRGLVEKMIAASK